MELGRGWCKLFLKIVEKNGDFSQKLFVILKEIEKMFHFLAFLKSDFWSFLE